MAGPEDVGERLRSLRKLHRLTQQELADLAGVSKSLLSKVEAGQRPGSWKLVVAVAKPLRADAATLMGLEQGHAGDAGRVAACLPAIRTAFANYDLVADSPNRSMDDLAEAVESAGQLRLHSRYVALAESLPSLLADLTSAVHHCRGDEQRRAFALLALAYRSADAVAYKFGHLDLSMVAADRLRWAADQSGDELLAATATYVRAEAFFDTGATVSGLRLLEEAGERISYDVLTDARAASVYGALNMRAAVLAACGRDGDRAHAHLLIARTMADQVGRDVEFFHTSFGPSSVKVHEVAVAAELGDGDQAVSRARRWRPPPGLPAERASHHFIDVARAQTWICGYQSAVESLLTARRKAPQHTRAHPSAREVIHRRSCGAAGAGPRRYGGWRPG